MELILFCENRTIFTGANSFMDGSRACWAVIGIGSVSIGTIEDLVESSKNANAMVVSFEKNKLIFAAVIQEIGQDKAKLVKTGMIIRLFDSLGQEIEKSVLDRLSLDIKIVAFPKEFETKVINCMKITEEFCHKLQSCFPSLRYSKIDFLRQVSVQSVSFLDIQENSFNRVKILKIIEEYIENKLSSDIDKTGDRFTRLLENKLNEMQIERHKQPVGPSTVSYENKRSGPVGLKQNVPSPSLYSNTGNNEKVLFSKFLGWFEKIEPMAFISVLIVFFIILFILLLFMIPNN